MSEPSLTGNTAWNYHCGRCGEPLWADVPHSCPAGIYDLPGIPQYAVGWPTADYTAILTRIAETLDRIADRMPLGPDRRGM